MTNTATANERLDTHGASSAPAVACVALALLLLSSYVLNTTLFPAVAATFPPARELSTYAGAAFSIVLAVLAYRKPSVMIERAWSGACLVASAVASVCLYIGIAFDSPHALIVGSPIGGMSSVWFSVLMGVALSCFKPAQAGIIIPAAFALNYALSAAVMALDVQMPLAVAAVTYFGLIAVGYALIRKLARQAMIPLRDSAAPTVLTITSPSSYLPPSHVVYVCILLFNLACGYASASQSAALHPADALASYVPVLALLGFVCFKRVFAIDGFYRGAVLLVFAGFLLSPFPFLSDTLLASQAPNALLRAGSDCFNVLMYYLVASIGYRNKLGAVSTCAFAFAAQWIGVGTGALIAQGISHTAQESMLLSLCATCAVTFVFMAFSYVMQNRLSFSDTIERVVPAQRDYEGEDSADDGGASATSASPNPAAPGASIAADSSTADVFPAPDAAAEHDSAAFASKRFDEACEAVAKRYGLTSRETDVLKLLGRGRTAPIIQEKLVLSHNTVKTHVRHVYSKLDVHSQQELISIVEHERTR